MWRLISLAVLISTAVGLSEGGKPGPRLGQGGPCGDDLKKFCANVTPGGGAVFECMKKNEAQLSATCKEHMTKMSERIGPMKEAFQVVKDACSADVEKFCKEAPAGHGGKIRCLHANQDKPDFSEKCKEAMSKMKELKPGGPMTPPGMPNTGPGVPGAIPSPTPTK